MACHQSRRKQRSHQGNLARQGRRSCGRQHSEKNTVEKNPVLLLRKAGGLKTACHIVLISEKKKTTPDNTTLSAAQRDVSLEIYGPVTDRTYWQLCMQANHETQAKSS